MGLLLNQSVHQAYLDVIGIIMNVFPQLNVKNYLKSLVKNQLIL